MANKYVMRNDALLGKTFYYNRLTDREHLEKYFPRFPNESAGVYSRRPKLAPPIASSIIDRIVNILNSNLNIQVQGYQDKIDKIIEDVNLYEVLRDIIVNTLVTGNNLFITRFQLDYPSVENWSGEWVSYEGKIKAYEYSLSKEGQKVPVLEDNSKETIYTEYVNELIIDNIFHYWGFDPSVFTSNIDRYEYGNYGKTFIKRFNELIVHYNLFISQAAYSIRVLQNVWATNRSVDNPESPLIISPGYINYLGPNGLLEQVQRNLSTDEERQMMNKLEHHISRASQVPAELIGLENAGKIPSGVALSLIFQPLVELIDRLQLVYTPMVKRVVKKLLYMQLLIDKYSSPSLDLSPISYPDVEVEIFTNRQVVPVERISTIDQLIKLKDMGAIDDDYFNNAVKVFLPVG